MTKPNAAKLANAPRRGLSRVEAAIYIGVSTTKFDEMVAAGRMPKPKHIDARRVWDIRALDQAFDELPGDMSVTAPAVDWTPSNEWEVPPSSNDETQTPSPPKQSGRLRLPIEWPDNPQSQRALEMLRNKGLILHSYAPGEWEAEVLNRPMGKREVTALGQFYRVRNEPPHHIKGAGDDTAARLETRGFIVVAEEREGRSPYYRITPEGEAAWLSLQSHT